MPTSDAAASHSRSRRSAALMFHDRLMSLLVAALILCLVIVTVGSVFLALHATYRVDAFQKTIKAQDVEIGALRTDVDLLRNQLITAGLVPVVPASTPGATTSTPSTSPPATSGSTPTVTGSGAGSVATGGSGGQPGGSPPTTTPSTTVPPTTTPTTTIPPITPPITVPPHPPVTTPSPLPLGLPAPPVHLPPAASHSSRLIHFA